MKRILTILLAGIMLISITACSNKNEDNPPGPTPDINTPTTVPDNWETKEVFLPFAPIITKEVTYTAFGREVKDFVMVSPLSYDKYKPEDTATALQSMELLNGWELTISQQESSHPVMTSQGQLTTYQYGTSLCFAEKDGDAYTGRSVEVRYTNNTDECEGYQAITLLVFGEEQFEQEQLFELLKPVYGVYAEFLCYADMKSEGGVSHTAINAVGCVTLSRIHSENNITFEIACMNIDERSTDGYAGAYEPTVKSFDILKLFGFAENEIQFENMSQFGHSFFEKYYGPSAYFRPNLTGGHAYSMDTSDSDTFTMLVTTGAVYQGEELLANRVAFQHTTYNDIEELYCTINLPIVHKEQVTPDTEASLKQLALNIVKDMMQQDIDFFEEQMTFDTEINEKDAYMVFSFGYIVDADGNGIGTITISATTDMTNRPA